MPLLPAKSLREQHAIRGFNVAIASLISWIVCTKEIQLQRAPKARRVQAGLPVRGCSPGNMNRDDRTSPVRGWVGLILVAVCWPLNWLLPGLRTTYLFFPLWLGYILVVDALVQARTGTSIWTRSQKHFAVLFLISAPVWWLFELINLRTGNWEYLGSELFSSFWFDLLSTVSFSIVVPAVLETAELMRSFGWTERFAAAPRIPATRDVFIPLFVIGLAMLSAILLWPKIFYPFTWISIVFIFEPINYWAGRPHFLEQLREGDWRMVVSLSVGGLMCGFFWEMWNYHSFPKWVYHTPGTEFLRIFEMPLLGYGGYIPFALEIYALKNFLCANEPYTG
jgi:hypothetical protein